MKKLLAALLAAFMVFAVTPLFAVPGFAENGQDIGQASGYIPFDTSYKVGKKVLVKDISSPKDKSSQKMGIREADSSLPSAYRSDKQVWARSVKVKDQSQTSLCWAFAMTTASEYSYAKELYDKTGSIPAVDELSPGHLGQFYYNRVNDPLGNTAGDSNSIPADQAWALYGGNDIFGMQHWASWSGAALESKYPIQPINDQIGIVDGYYQWIGPNTVFPDTAAYDDAMTMQESIVLFHPDKKRMKELILKYGAITASMEFDYRNYMNLDEPYLGGRSYYNYNKKISANHAVTIVGWDDNYPKERFSHVIDSWVEEAEKEAKKAGKSEAEIVAAGDAAAEAGREMTTPSSDGAWIVQNSWGDVHENGFLYVSYEDADFTQEISDLYAFDVQPADTYMYNFQYDGNSISSDSSDIYQETGEHLDYYTVKGSRAANVYKNTTGKAIKLEAVGYTTFLDADQEYEVSVYTGLEDPADPTSGRRLLRTKIGTSTMGCKTAVLDKAVYVAPGDTYSIVFEFMQDSPFGTETSASSPYFVFSAQIDPGQSFFNSPGSETWLDMNNFNACFRIKGFANPTKLIPTGGGSNTKKKASESILSSLVSEEEPAEEPAQPETEPEIKPAADPEPASESETAEEEKTVSKGLVAAGVGAGAAAVIIILAAGNTGAAAGAAGAAGAATKTGAAAGQAAKGKIRIRKRPGRK